MCWWRGKTNSKGVFCRRIWWEKGYKALGLWSAIYYRAVKESFFDMVIFMNISEWSERASHENTWSKSVLDRGNRMCKGLPCSRNRKKAHITRLERRRMVGYEVRETERVRFYRTCEHFDFYSEWVRKPFLKKIINNFIILNSTLVRRMNLQLFILTQSRWLCFNALDTMLL